MGYNYPPNYELKLEMEIRGNMRITETYLGYFVSYNPISKDNQIESITINRIFNMADFILRNADPELHIQTLRINDYNRIKHGRWDF